MFPFLILNVRLQEYNPELTNLSKKDRKFNLHNGFDDNGVVLLDRNNIRNETEYYKDDNGLRPDANHQVIVTTTATVTSSNNTNVKRYDLCMTYSHHNHHLY